MKPGERMLSILPLAHTYECTLGMLIPFSRGAQVSYLARPASPSYLMKSLATVRPHLMLAVPLLIEKIVRGKVIPQLSTGLVSKLKALPLLDRLIYRKAGAKLVRAFGGRLRFFGIGGAPLAADVESVLYRMGFPYAIGYGLTETAPLLAGTSPDANHLRSTGLPTPGVEIRIHEGEIQAKGPNIMKGYYRDPERTAEVFTEDGWFRTGDLGELDAAGRLFVKGRSKTVLLGSSGENIYPEAIESVINQFTGVEESLVTQEGSRLVARVKLDYENLSDSARSMAGDAARRAGDAAGAAADAAGNAADHAKAYLNDLRKRLNERLSSFNRISEIREQEEPFAKTPTSKIKRYLYQHKHGGDSTDGGESGDNPDTGSGGPDGSSEKS
jgi:long-chain acyl-CoA synthetase